MFIGYNLVGTSIFDTPNRDEQFNIINVQNVAIDDLYCTSSLLLDFSWNLDSNWDSNTIIYGTFKGNANAGNIEYVQSIVQCIRIKRRFSGESEWQTIYEKEIDQSLTPLENFNITFVDSIEPSNKDIEYMYVCIIDNQDTMPAITSVHSEFDSDFLVGQNNVMYPVFINVDDSRQLNRESAVIVSPSRQYPYIVNKGIAKYYSGTLSAVFIPMNEDCTLDADNGWNYRNTIDSFLTDGQAKLFKTFEGDVYLCAMDGGIVRSVDGHYQLVSSEISWNETGDPYDAGDLYDNGFINTDIDRKES